MKLSFKKFGISVFGKKGDVRNKLWTVTGIMLLAFALSWCVAQPFSLSIGSLTSNSDKKDFNITDFYNIVADARPVRTLDSDIVIVNIDRANRDDIVDLLDILNIMGPKAVGLDVTFNERRDGDTLLLNTICSAHNLVLASTLSQSGGVNDPDDNSWFYPVTRHTLKYGVVNLPSKFEGATIRNFPLWFNNSKDEQSPSFVMALAQLAAPQLADKIKARGNEFETIDFPSHEFKTIDWTEVPDRPEDIENKIVLIGADGDTSDIHATPINEKMTGVKIHAHALSTILNERFYHTVPSWINMLLAVIGCVFVIYLSISISSPIKGISLRLVQVALLYLIIRIGYSLFIDKRIIIDFSYSLLMLAFAFFAADIWSGSAYLINKTREKICQKTNFDSTC